MGACQSQLDAIVLHGNPNELTAAQANNNKNSKGALKILLSGLPGSGKSALLLSLIRHGESMASNTPMPNNLPVLTPRPTRKVGFTKLNVRGTHLLVGDLPGPPSIDSNNFFSDEVCKAVKLIVHVIDSTDPVLFALSYSKFMELYDRCDELRDRNSGGQHGSPKQVRALIIVSKQDKSTAIPMKEIKAKLDRLSGSLNSSHIHWDLCPSAITLKAQVADVYANLGLALAR